MNTETYPKKRLDAGLSREEVENALENFLQPENPAKVFVVKGSWGIGKTHLVEKFLSRKEYEYHYGSMFGIPTIEDLKMQLLSNHNKHTSKGNKQKNILRIPWINRNSNDIGHIVEAMPKMGLYGIGFTPAILKLATQIAINTTLKNKLICIDDLERHSSKVSFDEILGFIENFSGNKKCKFIVIFNEHKINEESKKILQEYREKVIDFEVNLSPSLEENIQIGFGSDDPDPIVLEHLEFFSNPHSAGT